MKVGIIGAAGHFQYALRALKSEEDVRVVGIAPGSAGEKIDKLVKAVDRLDERTEPRLYTDAEQLLDEAQPNIAVVNPLFADHARVAIQALQRNIHVFVEKPIATTWEDLEQLRKAYDASTAQLSAMFGIRYAPAFQTAKRALEQGAVGDVRLMQAQKSYRLGTRPDFFKRRATYGGTIPWVGSHAIDWLYWLGGKRFTSVMAAHSSLYNDGHGELEVAAQCHFRLENGAMATASIDYLRPGTAPTHDDDRIRIAGSNGVLEVMAGKVTVMNEEEDGIRELPVVEGVESSTIFTEFLNQIRRTGTCSVSAADAFYVTEACLRARDSADQGTLVHF